VKRDIKIIPDEPGDIQFDIFGETADTGHQLLQRLIVLLLSNEAGTYRDTSYGVSLLSFLEGGNIPADAAMNSILGLACAAALRMLDAEDRELVSSFTGTSTDGVVTCVLKLTDGTTLSGVL